MGLFERLSKISRNRKLELFYSIMRPTAQTKILDVGAEVDPRSFGTPELIDSYPWRKRVSALNISPQAIATIRQHYPDVDAVVGDACHLPWPDNYFDVVFSNAVIEHVGDLERQRKMAGEIMRVGKRWFVATPNRWYPFEFHLRLPLVTWLPKHGYLWAGSILRYSHVRKKYLIEDFGVLTT